MGRYTVDRACQYCGSTFQTTPTKIRHGGGKYCNAECQALGSRKRIQRTCEQCGKGFEATPSDIKFGRGKYCSLECKHNARYTSIECTCPQCGKVFIRNQYRVKTSMKGILYCSKECAYSHDRTHVERICEICGKHFDIVASVVAKGKAKYCSQQCMGVAARTRITVNCLQCGTEFMTSPKRIHKYCSNECKGLAKQGAGHHMWRGGHSDYRGKNWNAQRKLAYARDGGVCQICHTNPKAGQRKNAVHHIRKYREFNGDWLLANDLSNLITLCQSCHMRVEQGKIPSPVRLF